MATLHDSIAWLEQYGIDIDILEERLAGFIPSHIDDYSTYRMYVDALSSMGKTICLSYMPGK